VGNRFFGKVHVSIITCAASHPRRGSNSATKEPQSSIYLMWLALEEERDIEEENLRLTNSLDYHAG